MITIIIIIIVCLVFIFISSFIPIFIFVFIFTLFIICIFFIVAVITCIMFLFELVIRVGAQKWKYCSAEDWQWKCLDVFVVPTSLWEVFAVMFADAVNDYNNDSLVEQLSAKEKGATAGPQECSKVAGRPPGGPQAVDELLCETRV
ncbi:hypothetical protein AK812_SmicGene10453 [Symbiodinium microadriaticum]|uniref:Uncharacterized protein n=1 Tax=Symbiodinium microadriaticum TaxID=2951 RepID=A0A1Q9EFR4_SYMMI|nr:hypothetical protein AK812_SmicGene10453 [Symbiodinium microadriaticum]